MSKITLEFMSNKIEGNNGLGGIVSSKEMPKNAFKRFKVFINEDCVDTRRKMLEDDGELLSIVMCIVTERLLKTVVEEMVPGIVGEMLQAKCESHEQSKEMH